MKKFNIFAIFRIVGLWGSLFLFITSCGVVQPFDHQKKAGARQHDTTNPEFSAYVESFEERAQKVLSDSGYHVGDIPVNFGDTEKEGRVGVCFEYHNGEKEILIDKTWWNNRKNNEHGENSKESLIFHELGHCALGRGHNNETALIDDKKYKLSIMNKNLVQGDPYKNHKGEYHQELFTQDEIQLIQSLNSQDSDDEGEDESTQTIALNES